MIQIIDARKPRIGIINTSASGGGREKSLTDAVGIDGEAMDMTFENGVRAIVVRLRKPIENTGTKSDISFVLRVSETQGEVLKNVNAGIFQSVTGEEEWIVSDVREFPRRINLPEEEGFSKYNYFFAVTDLRTVGSVRWAAATLEVEIYPA